MSLKRTVYINRLKKMYKKFKEEDSEIGREINRLIRTLYVQNALAADKRDKEVIVDAYTGIKSLREESRFRYEFPQFSIFKKYVEEMGISLADLEAGKVIA